MVSVPSVNHPRIISLVTDTKFQRILIVVIFCVITLFDGSFWIFRPYDGLGFVLSDTGIQVYQVYADGPAQQAGFQVGDQILAIAGRAVDPQGNRPMYKPGLGPGDVVSYTLQRNDQILTRSITLGSYLDNISKLGSIVGIQFMSLAFWSIGMLLCRFTPLGDVRARLIGLCWLLGAVAMAAGPSSMFWGTHTMMGIAWAWLAPMLIAAHLYFPAPRFVRQRGLIIQIGSAVALLLSLLITLDGWLLKPDWTWFYRFTSFTRSTAVEAFFFLAVSVSIGVLGYNYFTLQNPDLKRQTRIVIWGMLLGFLPFFGLTLVPQVLFDKPIDSGTYSVLALIFVPLAYAYVIYQQRLLHLDLLINRTIVLFLVAAFLLMTSALLLGVPILLFNLPLAPSIAVGALAALFSLPSAKLQAIAQKWVNQILYGSHYDFSTVNAWFSSRLARTVDRDELTELLTHDLAQQMGIRQVTLFLAEDGLLRLQSPQHESCSIPLNDKVCQLLSTCRMPVRIQAQDMLVTTLKTYWQPGAQAQLLVPIIFESQLAGLLILGSRFSGDMYSNNDLSIIGSVADQAALAYANVTLVETLRGLTRRLVQADEAHRKHIARELHDTPLQHLFFIRQMVLRAHGDAELVHSLDEVIEALRHTIKDQRPSLLDQGLPLALEALVKELEERHRYKPTIEWICDTARPIQLSDEQTTALYRIAQEALNNAFKHAQAQHVTVKLDTETNNVLRLSITDDGIGMSESLQDLRRTNESYGLFSLQERAMMIQAFLHIASAPGQGTTVSITMKA